MISLGEELRREREFREISLREISEATKINMRMLEAIEHDNFKVLPGGIFNRNFIRAYAEFIGVDPEIAVRKYEVQVAEAKEDKIPPLTVSVIHTRNPENIWGFKRIVFYFLAAILLLALLFGLFRYSGTRIPFHKSASAIPASQLRVDL